MFDPKFWLNHYPGTNFHEMNIDWMIEAIKELAKELEQYEISLKPVPAGINITNSEYWESIANFTALIGDLGDRVEALEAADIAIRASISDLDKKISLTWRDRELLFLGDSY